MNNELILKIKAAILVKPAAFKMSNWFTESSDSPCGTSACLAGWAITLGATGSERPIDGLEFCNANKLEVFPLEGAFSGPAARLLGLPPEYPKNSLFLSTCWPQPFEFQYRETTDLGEPERSEARARIAADRLDYLLETGK